MRRALRTLADVSEGVFDRVNHQHGLLAHGRVAAALLPGVTAHGECLHEPIDGPGAPSWFGSVDGRLADFVATVEQVTSPADYPHAAAVDREVVV